MNSDKEIERSLLTSECSGLEEGEVKRIDRKIKRLELALIIQWTVLLITMVASSYVAIAMIQHTHWR